MRPYRVAVCDDDTGQIHDLTKIVSGVLDTQGTQYDIAVFASGESIVEAILEQNRRFDILFLDILMNEINGMAAARKIREQDKDISIVFITSSPNFVFEGYEVQALHYIMKPIDRDKIGRVLLNDWNKRNEIRYMDVKSKNALVRILFDDILYLESRGRKVLITTKDRVYETYGVLGQFYDMLPSNQFISCHKSYVVNLNHISQIMRTSFTTVYDQIIPISKACYPDAKKAFIHFIGKTR